MNIKETVHICDTPNKYKTPLVLWYLFVCFVWARYTKTQWIYTFYVCVLVRNILKMTTIFNFILNPLCYDVVPSARIPSQVDRMIQVQDTQFVTTRAKSITFICIYLHISTYIEWYRYKYTYEFTPALLLEWFIQKTNYVVKKNYEPRVTVNA